MKINSKIIITTIIVLVAALMTYFSSEPSYEIKEVTKEVKLMDAKK